MSEVCSQCGKEFKRIGSHWAQSTDCDYPELSEYQKEVVIGLLMGDGTVYKPPGENPRCQCEMKTREYLEYLNETVFPQIGANVGVHRTGEEKSIQNAKSGFSDEGANYSTTYQWFSRNSPVFKEFWGWYSSGEKVWPEDIDLTPTILKHWFVGDGTYRTKGNGTISISSLNEIDNEKKIKNYFEEAGLPEPTIYNYGDERAGHIRFPSSTTEEIFEYMGEPLPGFEYKWPEEYRTE